jgi:Predicted membrane protein (DUF2207)
MMTFIITIISLCIGLAIPYLYALAVRVKKYQTTQDTTVIAHYEPPLDLRPAEMGYIYDSHLGGLEIWATLIHLEQQGFIRLTPVAHEPGSVKVERLRPTDTLLEYEDYLVRWTIRNDGIFSLKVSDSDQALFIQQVRKHLVRQGYIATQPRIWILLTACWLLSLVAVNSLSPASGNVSTSDPRTYLYVPCLIIAVLGRVAGGTIVKTFETKLSTKKLRRDWPLIEGYRLFLETTEANRLRHTASAVEDVRSAPALPYVIALDLYPKWENILRR